MREDKQLTGALDWGRLLAAWLVIAIHTSPLSSFDEQADFILTRIVARLAVPFFLLTTGYFLLVGEQKSGFGQFLRFAQKPLLLYAAAILLYLPLNLYAGHLQNLNLTDWLRLLLFDGTFYHLWYLPALLLGGALLFLLQPLPAGLQLGIAALLYLLGLLGDSYYGLLACCPPLLAVYEAMFSCFSYTRNGLFYAPLFLLLGSLCRKKTVQNSPGLRWRYTAGLAASLLWLLAEGLILHHLGWQRHDSMYLALPAAMWFLFRLALSLPCPPVPQLRPLSLLIYILHPAVLVAVRGLGKAAAFGLLLDNSLLRYLAVCLLTTATAHILIFLTINQSLLKGDSG